MRGKTKADWGVYLLIGITLMVLAATAVLTIDYLRDRAPYPDGTYLLTVEGEDVLVVSDPNTQLYLVSEGEPQTLEQQQAQEQAAQEQQAQEQAATENTGTGGEETEAAAQEVVPAGATPVTPTPVVTTTPDTGIGDYLFVSYTVVAGDTLYSIANTKGFNTTIPLMARFGIDSTQIYTGNVIQVPVANPAACPGNYAYVVRAGDTLSSIAVKCGTTVDNLKAINGISGDTYRLDETSVLCVPNPPT